MNLLEESEAHLQRLGVVDAEERDGRGGAREDARQQTPSEHHEHRCGVLQQPLLFLVYHLWDLYWRVLSH